MDVMTPALARSRLLYYCVVMAAALAMVSCTGADGQSNGRTAASGTLTGRITRGPMFPVGGPGVPPATSPVAGAEIKLLDAKGVVVATARTDGDGLYRVAVPPGQYRVERGQGFTGATKNLPSLVAVSPGHETRLDILVDTGIR